MGAEEVRRLQPRGFARGHGRSLRAVHSESVGSGERLQGELLKIVQASLGSLVASGGAAVRFSHWRGFSVYATLAFTGHAVQISPGDR